jgi:hypothetical protein
MIDWRMFETAFGPLYAEVGRPGLPKQISASAWRKRKSALRCEAY